MSMADGLERLLASLHPDPGTRGREFERLCKWFLETDPQYMCQVRRVWLWRDWPDRPGADLGIDLVAQTHDGDLWAVQAKAYDRSRSVSKRDLDTFLSASSTPAFSTRLLIATTDHVAHNARRTIGEQEKPVHLLLLSDLRDARVLWPESIQDLAAGRRVEPKTPLPHQEAALSDLLYGLKEGDRGQLVMPCGTGKTLVSLWLANDIGAKQTLVLVPSLSLMRQTISEWTANAPEPLDILAVCSDDSVTGSDEVLQHVFELPWPATTDPDEVHRFLDGRGERRRVVFCTYQSSPVISQAQQSGALEFDLTIADEAHRCAGKTTGPFATVLDGDAIRSRKRVFATATPRYIAKHVSRRAEELGLEVVSMDDETVFGPVMHKLSFGTAVRDGLLCDYRVLVIGVDDQDVLSIMQRGTYVETPTGVTTDVRTVGAQVAVARAMREFGLHRVITFHNRVARARDFADGFEESLGWFPAESRPDGTVWSRHVSGKMTAGRRREILNRLARVEEGEYAVVANARCLVEGVDVRSLDGIVFVDPRVSEIDIVQAVGRVMRTSPETGKTRGTVVIPIAVDSRIDPDVALEDSSFSVVWSVVKALRAHDEEFGTTLDKLRLELGRSGTLGPLPDRVDLQLGSRVDESFARRLTLRLVESTTSSWESMFGCLVAYVAREGHASPPATHEQDGFTLGWWVRTQRSFCKRGRLNTDRVSRLERLPGWTWDVSDAQWEEAFQVLERFVAREGHAGVPVDHKEDGFALGSWVNNRRSDQRQEKLGVDHVSVLEALPGWTWNPNDAKWEEAFQVLERFVAREGSAKEVPGTHREDGRALGAWVNAQRSSWKRDKLRADRVSRLEAVPGWTWNLLDARWDEAFASLERFVARRGHADVPQGHVENDFALGGWVSTQRMRWKRGRLSIDRISRLEALPGWRWPQSESGTGHVR